MSKVRILRKIKRIPCQLSSNIVYYLLKFGRNRHNSKPKIPKVLRKRSTDLWRNNADDKEIFKACLKQLLFQPLNQFNGGKSVSEYMELAQLIILS